MLRALVSTTLLLVVLSGCASTAEESAAPDGTAPENTLEDTTQTAAVAEEEDFEDFEDFEEFADYDANDPLETPNRLIFAMNEMVDVVLLQPVAAGYRFLLPDGVRDSVRNFARNLRSPVILANDVFQGDEERVKTTFSRFMINSTLGIGGLFDIADGMGYPFHKEDFGQTLGTYGVGEGFYLVLPILGPSSARDGTGLVVDTLMDPFRYIFSQQIQLTRFAVEGIDLRSRNIEAIEELRRDSVDFYARIRSLYRQHRENEINNGRPIEDIPVPGFVGDTSQGDSDDWADDDWAEQE
nr:VacJ family lipoprotein [Desulfuromonadales bacterium]